jgi:translation initiation factor 2 alpha subunit (eIF-2alpha)
MENYQSYSNENPIVGELVLLQFTERTDSFFHAKLLEYNYRGMMSYKVYNWNKIIPMNKNMVARVEKVDPNAKIVQVSVAYLNDDFEDVDYLNNNN